MHEFLQIGEIINTHGLKGELKVLPLTDDPLRYDDLEWVHIDKNGAMERYDIERVKYFKGFVILKLKGLDTIEAANAMRGMFILVDRKNAVKLPEDSYFICDIIGSSVSDINGIFLGKLVDILQTGSNDVFVVKNDNGRELLLPALKNVVRSISQKEGIIIVEVPEGLSYDEV